MPEDEDGMAGRETKKLGLKVKISLKDMRNIIMMNIKDRYVTAMKKSGRFRMKQEISILMNRKKQGRGAER